MQIDIDFEGQVVERQELLNGTESLTIEGASVDADWRVNLTVTWNVGILEYPGEGDITLTYVSGAELYGTVGHSLGRSGEGEDAQDWLVSVRYDIDGGTREFSAVSGQIWAELSVRSMAVLGKLRLMERT